MMLHILSWAYLPLIYFFAHFFLKIGLFFQYWVVKIFYIFRIQIIYQIYDIWILFPTLWLIFLIFLMITFKALKFFLRFHLFMFRIRGRERKKRKTSMVLSHVVASCVPSTGDLACNPGMYPDWESNWRPFGSQASTQFIELHQPGLKHLSF